MADSKDSPSAHDLPALSARPDLIGRVLSERYRIEARVALGAFGAVYRGVHLHMRKEVAIKVLHPEIENFPELVERFEREAVAGAHISHPNVASAMDLGKFDGDSYFLVQEYVRGETLRQLLDRGPLPAARAARIARQIAAALGAAHRRGIVHRDLKPTNVMLVHGTEDFTKLIDFGFAKVPLGSLPHVVQDEASDWAKSEAGVVFGTVAYLAPEAALGMRNVTERSDLYALGIIFYELIAGRHPFDISLPSAELFAKHRYALPPRFAELDPELDVPPAVEAVVQRLLAKDPAERFADAQAVIDALDQAMGRDRVYRARANPDSVRPSRWLSAKLAIPIAPGVPALPSPPKSHARWLLLAAVLGVLAVAIVYAQTRVPAESVPETARTGELVAPAEPVASSETGEREIAPRAREHAEKLVKRAASGDPVEIGATLLALIDTGAGALADDEVQTAAATLLARLPRGEEITDKLFHALAYDADAAGLDLLYLVYERFPGSHAARRAESILKLQATSARASPALRITWELSRAACSLKPALFERAAKEGDARTLRLLSALRSPKCQAKRGECCMRRDLVLDKTISSLKARGVGSEPASE